MFDAHAHAGEYTEDAFVSSASTDEYHALLPFPWKALGALPGYGDADFALMEKAAAEGFHIGEIGLDRRYGGRDEQIRVFRRALSIARDMDRAAVVHDVREHQAVLDAVRASGCRRVLIHGFTGSREIAMEYLRLGALISLGPRAEGCRSFPDLIRLPFVTESDMPAGEEERRVLAGWNRKLSELTGIDIGERTERIMKEVLG